jgi:hypothetical protein
MSAFGYVRSKYFARICFNIVPLSLATDKGGLRTLCLPSPASASTGARRGARISFFFGLGFAVTSVAPLHDAMITLRPPAGAQPEAFYVDLFARLSADRQPVPGPNAISWSCHVRPGG